jgi:hypothetical protein
MRANASYFNFQYPFVPLRSPSSCLRLLSCLPVTSIPLILPSIMCFKRQFLRKMWPVHIFNIIHIPCICFIHPGLLPSTAACAELGNKPVCDQLSQPFFFLTYAGYFFSPWFHVILISHTKETSIRHKIRISRLIPPSPNSNIKTGKTIVWADTGIKRWHK